MLRFNFKRLSRLMFITTLVVIASCGGASAPPVDLPAPITGRITISNPDADGNVTITGTAGAVDGGSMVMAVNEETAGAVSAKILDMLVSAAYAQTTFPSICDEDGYSCAVAENDGSFELTLSASFGDSIVIGVIDEETGEFLSDIIRRAVGEVVETVVCAGYDIASLVVDIKIDPVSGNPILLKEGSDLSTNQIIVGSDSTVTIPIAGCDAHSLITTVSDTGSTLFTVSSTVDKIVTGGILTSDDEITEMMKVNTEEQPMHLISGPSGDKTILKTALDDDGQISIDHISTETEESIGRIYFSSKDGTSITPLTNLTKTLDIKRVTLTGNRDLVALLAMGSSAEEVYLMFFDAASLEILATIAPADFDEMAINAGTEGLQKPISIALYIDREDTVTIGVVDSNANRLWIAYLTNDTGAIQYQTDLTDESVYEVSWYLSAMQQHYFELFEGDDSYPINKIEVTGTVIAAGATNEYIAGSTSDGRLWLGQALDAFDYGVNNGFIIDIAADDFLVGLALNEDLEIAFVADQTATKAISVSNEIWLN